MHKKRFVLLTLFWPLLFLLLLSSCLSYKPVPYFSDYADTAKPIVLKTVPFQSPVIQPDDILLVTISTLDNSLVSPVNTTNAINEGAQQANGYKVDAHGVVELPFVGGMKVSGLTTTEAQDTIKAAANKLFNSPIVNVRFANFKVTVLGEVRTPGSFNIPTEKVTIFDALGTAGDLTNYGKTNSILLVRDSTGDSKQMVRLNINSKNIINSPYYFLRPNDLIYVEPTSDKLINTTKTEATTRTISLVTSGLAIISTLLILVSKL